MDFDPGAKALEAVREGLVTADRLKAALEEAFAEGRRAEREDRKVETYWSEPGMAELCSSCHRPVKDAPNGELVILGDVARELQRTRELGFGLPCSMHEGYAILLEEMDELWDHVRKKQSERDLKAMRKEAIEMAAMAVKLVESLDAGRGRA